MQRHALLMYTSCGWFFEEISRPEGTQILRYAARALELAGDVAGFQLERDFLQHLSQAPSNVDGFRHGAEVYRQLVVTAQINFKQVAAQYAISSLFGHNSQGRSGGLLIQSDGGIAPSCLIRHPAQSRVYCYTAQQLDYQLQRLGPLTLAVGQLRLTSEITWESQHLVFAVLHLGGWDFHCCIQPFSGRRSYSQMKEQIFAVLQQASAAQTILAMTQLVGKQTFSLQNLFAEERHRIMRLLNQETLRRLDQLYTQVYRDNYSVLMAFHRDELTVPQELQVAAEIALGHRCLSLVRSLSEQINEAQFELNHLAELAVVATEAKHLRCQLEVPEAKQILEQLILRSLWQILHDADPATVEANIHRLEQLIEVGHQLNLNLSLERVQELYFSCLRSQILPQWLQALQTQHHQTNGKSHSRSINSNWNVKQLRLLLCLGQKLAVDVSAWLSV